MEFLRTPYNYDTNEASLASAVDCSGDEIRVKQEFAEETDINVLMKRFGLGAEIPENWSGLSVDTEPFDLQDAMNKVLFARDAFMELPANMRARFYNDPSKLMAFLDNPVNREEAVRLGLLKAPEVVPPPAVAAPGAS